MGKERDFAVNKMTQDYPKRLIEVDLPIKRISEHARREKSIRHGHISTLHIWWARRPLAACRAVICAALWPDPADPLCPQRFRDDACRLINDLARKAAADKELAEHCSEEAWGKWQALTKNGGLDPKNEDHWNVLRNALLDFIADFSDWDNSTVPEYLETSRALTQSAHEALGGAPGTKPLVVDPFAGGGSIPLEALRVGADAFASDLNPVAVLLNKVVLEYVPKFGRRLADEVRKWGRWVKEQSEDELMELYPRDPNGATPIAYIWARTIISEAPSRGTVPVEIPLIRSMWLANKGSRRYAFRWVREPKGRPKAASIEVQYADGETRRVLRPMIERFRPQKEGDVDRGTSLGGAATCPVTEYTVPVERVREQLRSRSGGTRDARLMAVVVSTNDTTGRVYRTPLPVDVACYAKAEEMLGKLKKECASAEALVPNEELNHLRGFFNVVLYGMKTWGDLFSPRQALALIVLAKHIKRIAQSGTGLPSDLRTAVQVCLSLALDKQADRNSAVCRWIYQNENIGYTFGRQALPMVWDFVETSPLYSGGAWDGIIEDFAETLEAQSFGPGSGQTEIASATSHPLPDDAADFMFTDPPYYSAVPYADLSDFFYVWLKRTIRDIFPHLFDSPLSPKNEECVALSHRAAMYRNKDSNWFEAMMGKSCKEAKRITKQTEVGCFVFANKETAGWEAMLAAIVNGGWKVTASWPIDTERPGRLRAQNSAALASSVHILCRPLEYKNGKGDGETIGDWREVLAELPRRIHNWMPRLRNEGVVGDDAIFACLGPALEVFSQYRQVEKASGEQVALKEYLEYVWAAVAKEALNMIFEGADATGFEEDARLTAMWLWTLSTGAARNGAASDGSEEEGEEESEAAKKTKLSGYVLEYDAARKIAQGLGAHLEHLTSVVQVRGDSACLLPVSERARHLFGKDEGAAPTKRKAKPKPKQMSFTDILDEAEEKGGGWGEKNAPKAGSTVLDRVHQSMILFAAGRNEAMKRFLVTDGAGSDPRFWHLADALCKLYPPGTDERRWVEGVMARKKGLGF